MWKWLLVFFALSFCFFNIQSGDVMMYLTIARDYILAGNWRQTDVHHYLYPSTNGQLIWHHEYLSMLLFYFAWWLGGFPGLILLKATLVGLTTWIIVKDTERPSALWLGLFALAIFAASFRFIERSSLFSDLFTVLLVSWLLRERSLSRSLLIRLVFLFGFWIQVHPGFPMGLVLVGLWAGWNRVFSLHLLFIPLVLLGNPGFLDGLLYPFRFALTEAVTLRKYNYEWAAAIDPLFVFARETLAFWALALIASGLLLARRAWFEALLGLTVFLLAVFSVRFVPTAAFVLGLVVRPFADGFSKRLGHLTSTFVSVLASLFLAAVLVRNFGWGYVSSAGPRAPGWDLDPAVFPTATLGALKQIPTEPMYNSHDFGAYLIWRGIKPVFHHGFVTDMDFYEKEVIGALKSPEQFFAAANRYGWKVLLVDRNSAYRQLYPILAPHPEWRIIAEDPAAYLIVKAP